MGASPRNNDRKRGRPDESSPRHSDHRGDQIPSTHEAEIDDSDSPLSLLSRCMKDGCQVLISVRNNRKVLGRIKAFDKHCNLLLEEAREMWPEKPRKGAKPINRDRSLGRVLIRGDNIILVLRNPNT